MSPPPFVDYGCGITTIDARYKRPGLVAIHLLVQGGQAAIVDTGTNHSLAGVLEVLRHKGIAPAQVSYVIVTHVHLDHAGGAGRMMREFPSARVVAHRRSVRHLVDPSRLIAGVTAVYGAEETARSFGEITPVPAERVIEAPDGFTLDLNGRELLFIDTPGHARHHFCVVDRRSRSIFAGDTFGLSYREFDTARGEFILPTTSPVQFEPQALHASIDRLMGYRPRQMLLAHWGRVRQLSRLAEDLHELIDAFVAVAHAAESAGAERHRMIVAGLWAVLLPRLRAHGCRLEEARVRDVLDMDVELNAQGLAVWLDRNRG